ncbi:unnamed protein product [Cylicostephanus goldi]|uniref:Uncharacterized protein n=1 Tax=Cylicostephanus goldi TaxID=71465 RepID=A0A3P6QFI2_CYLGO|nr:unnamed protein product [Cylicostephanus goldi]
MPPVTTNVWQQRMAARQREQQQQQAMMAKEKHPSNAATTSTPSIGSNTVTSVLSGASLYGTTPAPPRMPQGSAAAAAAVNKNDNQSSTSNIPVPIGPPNSILDKELPRKAPGYRSPSVQTSAGGSSVFAEQAVSSIPSSVSSTPPPSIASIGGDIASRCTLGSPPAPIAPPPGFTTLVSEVGKSVAAKSTTNALSSHAVDPPAVEIASSPLSTSTLPLGKLPSADSITTPTGTSNDLSSMQFLDESTRAKLAEIWGTGKQDQSSQEQAWGNQVLLNNFPNLSIGSSVRRVL